MIIGDKAILKWNNANKKYYIELGYPYTKNGDEFLVNINHLTKNSNAIIKVECDYCGGKDEIPYSNYTTYMDKSLVKKVCCNEFKCRENKVIENIKFKQNLGLLKKKDRGYWTFKENRLKEVKLYMDKYKTIDSISLNKEGRKLSGSLHHYGETVLELAIELGYDIYEIVKRKPDGYYDDFAVLENDIKKLIIKLDRFPKKSEITEYLGISGSHYIVRHGGIYEIKRKMGYKNDNDLVDKRGFYNKSLYELITANFLIENNIPYKREQKPFKGRNYCSDFTFYLDNEEIIHVELWGYSSDRDSKLTNHYKKVRTTKEKLYKKSNIKYISLEPSIFFQKKYQETIQSLDYIFRPILGSKLKQVDQESVIPANLMSDEEILNLLMNFSEDKDYLPLTTKFRNNYSFVYKEILKRYESYSKFGEKFNKKTIVDSNHAMNIDKIYSVFDEMISNWGEILSFRKALKSENREYRKVFHYINSNFNITDTKLSYFRQLKQIPEKEEKWIIKISNGGYNGKFKPTQKQQQLAKQILHLQIQSA